MTEKVTLIHRDWIPVYRDFFICTSVQINLLISAHCTIGNCNWVERRTISGRNNRASIMKITGTLILVELYDTGSHC